MLALPRDEGDYIVDTDASDAAVGAVLSQFQDGEERPVVYFSRLFSRTEVNYCTTRKELLAVVEGFQRFWPNVLGSHFRVRTDHADLCWFQRAPNLVGQQARWLDLPGEFDFEVEYRPGYKHGNANALSFWSCRSCMFCQQTRESECLATFTSPDARFEPEDRWVAERLETAHRAEKGMMTAIDWRMASDARTSCEQVQKHSEDVKEYWNQWELFELKEGVLYRRWVSVDGRLQWLQAIPTANYREEVMRRAHCEAAGHLGVRKTLEQVRRPAFWMSLRVDVERYCRRCEVCFRYHRGAAPRQGKMQDKVVGAPWESVGMDLTGKHPLSCRGNYYILMFLNHFTKFADAYPIPNKKAETICRFVVEKIFPRFWVSNQLLTDQGREFDNRLTKGLSEFYGIDKIRTSAY